MKILHIIYDDVSNPWVGGGGALRALEINKILAADHSITMVTGNYPGATNESCHDMQFLRVGSTSNYLMSRISFAFKIPSIIRNSDADLIVNEFSVFSPCFCQKHTKKPVVDTFYHIIGRQAFKKLSIFGIIPFLAEKKFLRTTRNIITISPSVTEKIAPYTVGKNVECIYTGIADDIFDVQHRGGKYIASLGRLDVYMKGLDILLEAYAGLKEKSIPLKIAGSGPEKNKQKLSELAQKLHLEQHVEFVGRISDEEKKDFLANAAIFVMPSRFEGWGITAIEAGACGVPVIGTDIPGLSDAIVDGKTGMLVPPENSEALTEAMEALLEDENRRYAMAEAAKEWAGQFRWDAIAQQQELFYKKVFEEKNSS